MGHFTRANIEAFVDRNATGWGNRQIPIRLGWGYRRTIHANVVALTLTPTSEMGFTHHAISFGSDRPALSRRQSPPLGIPMAAMEELEDAYSLYIREIVQNDLQSFVSVVFENQECKFAEQLFGAVCGYYLHGLQADEEVRNPSHLANT